MKRRESRSRWSNQRVLFNHIELWVCWIKEYKRWFGLVYGMGSKTDDQPYLDGTKSIQMGIHRPNSSISLRTSAISGAQMKIYLTLRWTGERWPPQKKKLTCPCARQLYHLSFSVELTHIPFQQCTTTECFTLTCSTSTMKMLTATAMNRWCQSGVDDGVPYPSGWSPLSDLFFSSH